MARLESHLWHATPMMGNMTRAPNFSHGGQAFDLNVEKVLDHWSVAFAIRELIANALDEQALTRTRDPGIFKDDAGYWHIADAGRGMRTRDAGFGTST